MLTKWESQRRGRVILSWWWWLVVGGSSSSGGILVRLPGPLYVTLFADRTVP
jgi:hypothetical protein